MNKWIPIVLVLFLAGCGRNEERKSESKSKTPSLSDGKIIKEEFGKCDSVIFGARLSIKVWESADTSLAARTLNSDLQNKVIDLISAHSDSARLDSLQNFKKSTDIAYNVFASNYRDFKADFPDAPGCWEIEIEGDTVMVTPKVLIYRLDNYAFTGGAHPNSFRSHHIFDAKNGKELNSNSFVADTNTLLRIVEKEFRKIEKIPAGTDLEEAGYFLQNHKFFLPANFTFTKKGVLFYYNAYEIASYARGAIEFVIPYDQLEGVVNKELIF